MYHVLVQKHRDDFCPGVHAFDAADDRGRKIVSGGDGIAIPPHMVEQRVHESGVELVTHEVPATDDSLHVRAADYQDVTRFLELLKIPVVQDAVAKIARGEKPIDPARLSPR